MKYTDLVFDLYGTLVDIRTHEDGDAWEKAALYFGYYGAKYTADELRREFQAAMRIREATAGKSYECYPDIPAEEVMTSLFRDKDVPDENGELGFGAAQLFRIASTEYIRLYPHVLEALAHFRKLGCRLWLLSNAQKVFTAYELRHLSLEDQFDGIYLSSDYGCRKPDSRFFRALLDGENLDPARCLMIGNDRLTDIAGAAAAGISTLYMHSNITPPGQAKADVGLFPGAAGRHWEYEGADWQELALLVEKLVHSR